MSFSDRIGEEDSSFCFFQACWRCQLGEEKNILEISTSQRWDGRSTRKKKMKASRTSMTELQDLEKFSLDEKKTSQETIEKTVI